MLRTLGHRYSQTEVEEMIKNTDKYGEEAVIVLMMMAVVVMMIMMMVMMKW